MAELPGSCLAQLFQGGAVAFQVPSGRWEQGPLVSDAARGLGVVRPPVRGAAGHLAVGSSTASSRGRRSITGSMPWGSHGEHQGYGREAGNEEPSS